MDTRFLAAAIAVASVSLHMPANAQGGRMQEAGSFRDHGRAVYFLSWSPDGTRIATAGGDGAIAVRTVAGGDPLFLQGHRAEVWGLAWSPDGARIVSVALEQGARIWDAATGREEARLEWQGSGAHSVAWSPDGGTIAVGTASGLICVFDYPSGRLLERWQAHSGDISSAIICLAWSPEGDRLASGSIDATAKIWNGSAIRAGTAADPAASGGATVPEKGPEPLVTLKADTRARNDINGLAWSPDGSMLATAGQDGNLRLWDSREGRLLRTMFHGGGWVRGVSFSPDGTLVAASGNSRLVSLWLVPTGESAGSLAGHYSPVWALQWSPDGSTLASGSGLYTAKGGDCSLRLWRRAPGTD